MPEPAMEQRGGSPPHDALERFAREALAEDLGEGDLTTDLLVPDGARARATMVARAAGVACGIPLARAVFLSVDPSLEITTHAGDGEAVPSGAPLLAIEGSARSILKAERVALNFVGRLSGIATLTRRYVAVVEGTSAAILDTRKTTPGLRALEKWAVRCGGGRNHRLGLYDGFMLKDNHRAALTAAGVELAWAVREARARIPDGVLVTIEVDSLDQIPEALEAGADSILLDNMTPRQLAVAVDRIGGRALAEASGGITLDTARAVAESGVDLISVGALTHSAPALDVALDFAMDHAATLAAAATRQGS